MTEENNDLGLTCLYKNGENQIFEGKDVEKAMKEGWKDEPQAVKPEKPEKKPDK